MFPVRARESRLVISYFSYNLVKDFWSRPVVDAGHRKPSIKIVCYHLVQWIPERWKLSLKQSLIISVSDSASCPVILFSLRALHDCYGGC